MSIHYYFNYYSEFFQIFSILFIFIFLKIKIITLMLIIMHFKNKKYYLKHVFFEDTSERKGVRKAFGGGNLLFLVSKLL